MLSVDSVGRTHAVLHQAAVGSGEPCGPEWLLCEVQQPQGRKAHARLFVASTTNFLVALWFANRTSVLTRPKKPNQEGGGVRLLKDSYTHGERCKPTPIQR